MEVILMIRLIIVLLFLVVFLIVSLPIILVEWIIGHFNPDLKARSSLAIVQWAFRVIIFLCGTKLTIIGEERIPKDEAVLYVGNHRSFFDTVITYARVPGLTGYVSKKEMLKVPVLSIWMRILNCEFLDRDDIKAGLKVILSCIDKVKAGISICIFPEGTRCKVNDTFLPFKEGSFKIATKTGCAVVPMAIINTADIFEDHFPKIRKTHVIIEYCEPIYPGDLDKDTLKHIGAHVQKIVEERYWENKKLL